MADSVKPGPSDSPAPHDQLSQGKWRSPTFCPECLSPVSESMSYCGRCGYRLRDWFPPWLVPPPSPTRHRARVATGIVLLVLLVTGIGVAYAEYRGYEAQVSAQNAERNDAAQALNHLEILCASFSNDTTWREEVTTEYVTVPGYSGQFSMTVDRIYLPLWETLRVQNPSKFSLDAVWTLEYIFTPSLSMLASQPFSLLPGSGTFLNFTFKLYYPADPRIYLDLQPHVDFSHYTLIYKAAYNVTGAYGTYPLNQRFVYQRPGNLTGPSSGSPSHIGKC